MSTVTLVARVFLAVVFATAGLAKLSDLRGSRATMREFGVSRRGADLAGTALPFAELITAIALLPQPTARWGGVLALILLCIFIAGISNALIHGRTPNCNCFGQVASERITWRTLARNVVLAAVAVLVISQGPGASIADWTSNHSASDVVASLAVGACLLLGVLAIRYRQKTLVLADRLADATRELASLPRGLPVGLLAPRFELDDINGSQVSLEALCDIGRPVVLVFTSPSCGPCIRLMPQLERWHAALADRVTLAVITNGPRDAAVAMHEVRHPGLPILLQDGQEVAERYRIRSTPKAVVVSPEATIASASASGAVEIEELIRLTLRRSDEPFPPVAERPLAGQPA